jgi:Tfp pilus assembly protein PilW
MHVRSRPRDDRGFGLLEIVIVSGLLGLIVAIVMSYLVSANRTVSLAGARAGDNAAAERAMSLLDADIRFATNMSISSSGPTLYVQSSTSPVCAAWSLDNQGNLTEETKPGSASAVARGVTGLTFSGTANYAGLVTVAFTLAEPQNAAADKGGVAVNETITAENMSGPVTSSSQVCTP